MFTGSRVSFVDAVMDLQLEQPGLPGLGSPAKEKKAKAKAKTQSRKNRAADEENCDKSGPASKKQKVQDVDPEKMKKCKKCKKNKPMCDFYSNQAGCKQCSKDLKNLENRAKACKETEWFRALDEAERDSLLQAYNREKDRAEKEKSKVSFNMLQFKNKTVHAQGLRKEGRRRFMTEMAYMEWTKTAEGGCLTKSQAEAKWLQMKDNPQTVSEGEGIDLKLAVPIYTDLVDFDEHAREREIVQAAKLNSKMSAKELEQKTRDLVLAKETEAQDKMLASLQDTHEEGIVLEKVSDLQAMAKKRPKVEVEDVEDEDASEAKAAKVGEPESSPKPSPSKWFDAQAERAKATRQFISFLQKRKDMMLSLCSSMKEAQDAAREVTAASADQGKSFLVEFTILSNRLKALNLVLTGTPEQFSRYVTEVVGSCGDSKSQTSSAQDLALTCLAQFWLAGGAIFKFKSFGASWVFSVSLLFPCCEFVFFAILKDGWPLPQL